MGLDLDTRWARRREKIRSADALPRMICRMRMISSPHCRSLQTPRVAGNRRHGRPVSALCQQAAYKAHCRVLAAPVGPGAKVGGCRATLGQRRRPWAATWPRGGRRQAGEISVKVVYDLFIGHWTAAFRQHRGRGCPARPSSPLYLVPWPSTMLISGAYGIT